MKISSRQIEIEQAKQMIRKYHKKYYNFFIQSENIDLEKIKKELDKPAKIMMINNKEKLAKTLAYGSPTYDNL